MDDIEEDLGTYTPNVNSESTTIVDETPCDNGYDIEKRQNKAKRTNKSVNLLMISYTSLKKVYIRIYIVFHTLCKLGQTPKSVHGNLPKKGSEYRCR